MDIVTHLALGICTSETFRKKGQGKHILLGGAFFQCLPDADTAGALFLPADGALMLHRGITHSLFFAVAVAAIVPVINRFAKTNRQSFGSLFFFVFFQLILHDLLDSCNAYGTGLLEPFSNQRFSVNLLFVTDPLFSFGLVVAAITLITGTAPLTSRARWAWAALLLSFCYLTFAGINKLIIQARVSNNLQARGIHFKDYFTTPAPLNSMLWYIVVNADSCYYTAYSSVFDRDYHVIEFEPQFKNHALLYGFEKKQAVQNVLKFADGYYTVSKSANGLCINILRFGQIQGWRKKNAPFVLSYPTGSNNFGIASFQKNRAEGWSVKALLSYLKRIAGKT